MAIANLDASGYTPAKKEGDGEAMAGGAAGGALARTFPEVRAEIGSPVSLRCLLPDGVIAEIRFSGPVAKEHFDSLERYLTIAKENAPSIAD